MATITPKYKLTLYGLTQEQINRVEKMLVKELGCISVTIEHNKEG